MNTDSMTLEEIQAWRESLEYWTCPYCLKAECVCMGDEVDHE
jgi:hypothetical protein